MLYCRQDLTSRQLLSYENQEMVCVDLFCQGKPIIVSSMYRPTSCNKEHVKLNLSLTIEKMKNSKPHMILIGADLNFGNNFDL